MIAETWGEFFLHLWNTEIWSRETIGIILILIGIWWLKPARKGATDDR